MPPLQPISSFDRWAARYQRRRRVGCFVMGCLLVFLVPLACVSTLMLAYVLFPPEPVDMVVLGIDARPGEGYLTRTDSIMLLNISPSEMAVTLLSIPRDVFIEVPGYGTQRINTVNVLGEQDNPGTGGPDLIKASLETSFGIGVDNYVRLNFDAFVALIDAVGGIDVDVPQTVIDDAYPTLDGGTIAIRFDPGVEHMDGERALQYARTRHQDDDFRRAERQQQVVDALLKKLSNPRYVVTWPRVLQAIESHTDTDLSAWDMVRLGPALLLGWPNKDQRVLVREDLIAVKDGYWIPDYAHIAPWIAEQFD